MITLYPYNELGHVHHGWLDARHHFSFGSYRNPARTGLGELLVINDDRIAPGRGFPTHPHANMEIITYVRKGAITHTDSAGNSGKTGSGDVQVMSAGSGVSHSEYNHESEETVLYQIWIRPHTLDVTPRWEAMSFPNIPATDTLPLLVSGRKEDADKGALFIHQDAAIYGGRVNAGTTLKQSIKYQAYVLVSQGAITLNDTLMREGDGAEITAEKILTFTAQEESEILLIDVP